jgi:hypothetical protein
MLTGVTELAVGTRAQAMMGDRVAARKSYDDFLTLWKDADPKAEYARLQ